jgi:hypothetical protein
MSPCRSTARDPRRAVWMPVFVLLPAILAVLS